MSHASPCMAMCSSHLMCFKFPLTRLIPSSSLGFDCRNSQLPSMLPYRYSECAPTQNTKLFLFTWSQHSHCESIKDQTLTHIDPTMTHLGHAYQRIPPLPYGCTVEELRFFGVINIRIQSIIIKCYICNIFIDEPTYLSDFHCYVFKFYEKV